MHKNHLLFQAVKLFLYNIGGFADKTENQFQFLLRILAAQIHRRL